MRGVGQEVRNGLRAAGYHEANPVTSMKANVGYFDAAARFTVGCVILGVGLHHESCWAAAGLVPILTGVSGFCLLYLPFHIDTTFTDLPPSPHGPE